MKNQYVGDIGDYGKYALLHMFAAAGERVGVNWYLTEGDCIKPLSAKNIDYHSGSFVQFSGYMSFLRIELPE